MAVEAKYRISAKDDTKGAVQSAKEGIGGVASKIGDLVKGFAIANLAADALRQGFIKIKEAISGSYAAYEKQENAVIRLANAIRQNPIVSGEALSRFNTFASAMQRKTIFGDEQILQATAFAASLGLAEDQIRRIAEVSADVASAGIMDFDSAVEQLSRTFTGTAGTLGRTLPLVRDLTEEQLRQGKAVDIVAQSYAGMAKAMTNTVAGAHTMFKNLAGDIQETIGGILGVMRMKLEQQLMPVLENIQKWFAANASTIYAVFTNLIPIFKIVAETILAMLQKVFSIDHFFDLFALLAKSFVDIFKTAFSTIAEMMGALYEGIGRIFASVDMEDMLTKVFHTAGRKMVTAIWEALGGDVSKMTPAQQKFWFYPEEQAADLSGVAGGGRRPLTSGERMQREVQAVLGELGTILSGGAEQIKDKYLGLASEVRAFFGPELDAASKAISELISKGQAEWAQYQAQAQAVADSTTVLAVSLEQIAVSGIPTLDSGLMGMAEDMEEQRRRSNELSIAYQNWLNTFDPIADEWMGSIEDMTNQQNKMVAVLERSVLPVFSEAGRPKSILESGRGSGWATSGDSGDSGWGAFAKGIGSVMAGIGGLVSRFGSMIAATETFTNFMAQVNLTLAPFIKQIAEPIVALLKPLVTIIMRIVTALMPSFLTIFESLGRLLEATMPFWETLGGVVVAIGTIFSWLAQKVIALGEVIGYILQGEFSKIKTVDWGGNLFEMPKESTTNYQNTRVDLATLPATATGGSGASYTTPRIINIAEGGSLITVNTEVITGDGGIDELVLMLRDRLRRVEALGY